MCEMKIVGITGGVGAGKSEILNHLRGAYGAYVIEADRVGHLVMEPGQKAYEAICGEFLEENKDLLQEDGRINRGVLGGIVFSDKEKLEVLNGIVHPAVKRWICDEIERRREEGCRLLVIEAALLIEDHYDEICDELWYIHTDAEVRRARLKASRGYSDEKIDSIFKNQLTEAEFRKACQAVIDNSGDLCDTKRQIEEIFGRQGEE